MNKCKYRDKNKICTLYNQKCDEDSNNYARMVCPDYDVDE